MKARYEVCDFSYLRVDNPIGPPMLLLSQSRVMNIRDDATSLILRKENRGTQLPGVNPRKRTGILNQPEPDS